MNTSPYEQSQRLMNAGAATCVNVLFNANIANFVGMFTCEVSNVRDTVQQSLELNG